VLKIHLCLLGKRSCQKFRFLAFFISALVFDLKSRQAVFKQAQARLSKGLSVCIFPEGGVPEDESVVLDSFKEGAFRLAFNHKIPLAPIVFHDNKKRFSFTFFSGSPGPMRITLLPLFDTNQIDSKEKRLLKNQVREAMLNELEVPSL